MQPFGKQPQNNNCLATALHFQIRRGADTGCCLPVESNQVYGRSTFALRDSTFSRQQFAIKKGRLRNLATTNRTRSSWWHFGYLPRKIRPRSRLHCGKTLLVACSRPADLKIYPPSDKADKQGNFRFFAFLPIIFLPLMLLRLIFSTTRGSGGWYLWIIIGLSMLFPIVLIFSLVARRTERKQILPTTHLVFLALTARRELLATQTQSASANTRSGMNGATLKKDSVELCAWTGISVRKWRRRARGHRQLALGPEATGQPIALVGPRSWDNARWWIAQLAAQKPGRFLREVKTGWELFDDTGALIRICRKKCINPTETLEVIACTDNAPPQCIQVIKAPPPPVISESWWDAVTQLCTFKQVKNETTQSHLLSDLIPLSTDAIKKNWAKNMADMCAPLGLSPNQTQVNLNLDLHGPHFLVAGTTGAGKSEALTTYLLGLSASFSPTQLALVLVDYKGGAAFTPLLALPHVHGVLTDLKPELTARALRGLSRELYRRKTLLTKHHARDLKSLPTDLCPARILVVVDEFRELSENHPDLLESLIKLATQGRSLGIHLILATQRPSGVVDAQIRSNMGARLCLRVLEESDSHDVIGTGEGANLPAIAGRALLRTEKLSTLQIAYTPPQLVQQIVTNCIQVHGKNTDFISTGLSMSHDPVENPVTPYWDAPLPLTISTSEALGLLSSTRSKASQVKNPIAVLEKSSGRALWNWENPTTILVLGAPGMGKSYAAQALAASSKLNLGGRIHLISQCHWNGADTFIDANNIRLTTRLMTMAQSGKLRGDILVLDDIDTIAQNVDCALGIGAGLSLLEELIRLSRPLDVRLVITSLFANGNARWASPINTRFILSPTDLQDITRSGADIKLLPDALQGPGRGLLIEGSRASAAQLVLPPPHMPPAHSVLEDLPAKYSGPSWAIGGDIPKDLPLPSFPILVVGPPRSGRSNTLAKILEIYRKRGSTDEISVFDDLDQTLGWQEKLKNELEQGSKVIISVLEQSVLRDIQGIFNRVTAYGSTIFLSPNHELVRKYQLAGFSPQQNGIKTPAGTGVLLTESTPIPLKIYTPQELL